MKNKKLIIIGTIALLIMICLPNISKAGYESKANSTAWDDISISGAFGVCKDLSSPTSTLGNNTVDPHLILNKDWGAVAYLSLSAYGNGTKGYTSNRVDSHYTTTSNLSGIIDLGRDGVYNYEWVSALMKDFNGNDEYVKQYSKNLIDNKDTRYVEELEENAFTNNELSKGLALSETQSFNLR